MKEKKYDKEDKKYLIIYLVIGFILSFFIESGMNIAILGLFIYLSNKYISTTENLKEYDNYVFSDKYKFNKGKKVASIVLNIYAIIRVVSLLIWPQYFYIFIELLIIIMALYAPFEKYLEKKYVISK